ncbi:MAG: glycosyltransferase family 4 protein [Ruminiclostridium sp.]|jgi:glycosyltransferase involved in cell wall biosynthesis|nr:glycosyltransferase family 4 protein [Ruminiclostridium sp.]
MKIRVCFISLLAYPLFNPNTSGNVIGGAEINMVLLAKKLAEDPGYEISFLVDDYHQQDIEYYQNIRVIKYKGTGYHEHSGLSRKMQLYSQLLVLNADVYVYTTANSFLGKLVFLQKKLRHKKVIFRLSSDRNLDLQWYEKTYGSRFVRLYQYGLNHVSHIVCQTIKQNEQLKNRFGRLGKVIPNGFPIRQNIDTSHKKYILWVSRCLPLKQPHLFLDLAQRLPEESFVMIMPQNESGNSEIDREIQRLTQEVKERAGGLQNVTLLDYVPYERIQAYFDRARVFVCTSQLEGFPNTFIQACLGGTAILSFYIDPDGVLQKNNLGILCGDDMDAAVGFIRQMDEDSLKAYREKTLKYVSTYHSIDNSVRLYKELIDQILRQDNTIA